MRTPPAARRAAAALLAACALAGCGGAGPSSPGTVTITFWDDAASAQRTPLFKTLISQFEQRNPNIRVSYLGVPNSSIQQKYDTAIAGGSTPDVGGVTTSLLADVAGQGALAPLDTRLAASPLAGQLAPSMLDTVRATGPDAKLYEIPAAANTDVVWYRKDWFKAAGLSAPASWADLVKDAEALTDPAHNRFGWSVRGGSGSIFQMLVEVYGQSGVGSFFTPAGRSTLDDPANVAALRTLAALYGKQTPTANVNDSYTQLVAEFQGGELAMLHHNLGDYAQLMKSLGPDKVGAFLFPPAADGRATVVPNPIDGFGVFKGGAHQDAAWKFVEFLASPAANSYWNEHIGEIPANLQAQKDAWVGANAPISQAAALLADPGTRVVNPPTYLPQYSSITKAKTEPLFQEVLLGRLSAQEFLTTFADLMNTAEQDWKAHHH
jgi:multiple sugar transport system substrate-binding protein